MAAVFPAIANDRIFNFAADAATLPKSVIIKAQAELYNYQGSGMSIIEISHRGKEFDFVIKKAESDLHLFLGIPDDYAVLFLQGGAPLSLCSPGETADYIVTGPWGDKAYKEAQKYCKASLIWFGKNLTYLLSTIHGVESKNCPIPKK